MTELQSGIATSEANSASANSPVSFRQQDEPNLDIKSVEHWSSPLYRGDMSHGDRFLISVVDQRESNGQLFVDEPPVP